MLRIGEPCGCRSHLASLKGTRPHRKPNGSHLVELSGVEPARVSCKEASLPATQPQILWRRFSDSSAHCIVKCLRHVFPTSTCKVLRSIGGSPGTRTLHLPGKNRIHRRLCLRPEIGPPPRNQTLRAFRRVVYSHADLHSRIAVEIGSP